jgi:hypothetical protein
MSCTVNLNLVYARSIIRRFEVPTGVSNKITVFCDVIVVVRYIGTIVSKKPVAYTRYKLETVGFSGKFISAKVHCDSPPKYRNSEGRF